MHRPTFGTGARWIVALIAAVLTACHTPLPDALLRPAVLDGASRVDRSPFASVPDGSVIFDLRLEADGRIGAATRRGIYWFGPDGELVREVRLEIDEPLLFTRLLPGEEAPLVAGSLGYDLGNDVGLFAGDGRLLGEVPSMTGRVAVGDFRADGRVELLTGVERKCEPWWKLCTWLAISNLEGEHLTHGPTHFSLEHVEVISEGPRAGQLVLTMHPNEERDSRFEVWDEHLEPVASWDTVPVGAFDLAYREGIVEVLTNEGDELVFRDLEGNVGRRLSLPHAGALRTPLWAELGGGWGVAVVSGFADPRFLLAVFDPAGRIVYREVSAPHAEDLLADPRVPGRFLVPAGSEILAYTVDLTAP